jgi:hypothetical protein
MPARWPAWHPGARPERAANDKHAAPRGSKPAAPSAFRGDVETTATPRGGSSDPRGEAVRQLTRRRRQRAVTSSFLTPRISSGSLRSLSCAESRPPTRPLPLRVRAPECRSAARLLRTNVGLLIWHALALAFAGEAGLSGTSAGAPPGRPLQALAERAASRLLGLESERPGRWRVLMTRFRRGSVGAGREARAADARSPASRAARGRAHRPAPALATRARRRPRA